MPRIPIGTYELPELPFAAGTLIRSAVMNSQFADIATALTESLSRDGDGYMRAPLKLDAGSAAEPALTFNDDAAVGFYLASGGTVRVASASTNLQEWKASKVTIYPACDINGNVSLGGSLAVTGSSTFTALVTANGGLTVNGVSGQPSINGVGAAFGSHNGLPTKYVFGFGTVPELTGQNYGMVALTSGTAGNMVRLSTRLKTTATATTWTAVRLGLSFDVDSSIGAGGSLWLGNGTVIAEGDTGASGVMRKGYVFGCTADGSATFSDAVRPATVAATISSGWTNSTSPVGYYKNGFGEVQLVGKLTANSTGSTAIIFTLPTGYRPAQRETFACISQLGGSGGGTVAVIDVLTNGEVTVQGAVEARTYTLTSIRFPAA